MTPPNPDRPATPPGIRADMIALEGFTHTLATGLEGVDKRLDGMGEDVREIRKQQAAHEERNIERERELRSEIRAQGERADKRAEETDKRLDKIEQTLQVVADRLSAQPQSQPQDSPPAPPGPITSALGLPPRQPHTGRGAAVAAGGGLSLAAVLGLLTQLAALPVALQWALAAVAAAAITACVVVGVRMTRRD